jgi:hypothetical protein
LELACVEVEAALVEVVFSEGQFKTLIEEVSIGAGSYRSLTPSRILHRTSACLPQKAEHMIRAVRVMAFQLFLEEVRNLKWQAQHDVAGAERARLRRCL